MTFTINFGWWLLPTIITLLAIAAASFAGRDDGYDQYEAGSDATAGLYAGAAIISLIAWLIWALVA